MSNPADEQIIVVDGCDRRLRSASRRQMRAQGLLHRVSYILVFNQAGELLVQTRTQTKDWYPGRLDLAAGGVLQDGETYDQSARRELHEELGIDAALEFQFKVYFEDRNGNPPSKSWGQVYSCVHAGPFSLQAEEVAAVEFMPLHEVFKIPAQRVTPDSRLLLYQHLL